VPVFIDLYQFGMGRRWENACRNRIEKDCSNSSYSHPTLQHLLHPQASGLRLTVQAKQKMYGEAEEGRVTCSTHLQSMATSLSASKKGSKRWTHFYSALQLAIQRSAHKWTFEDFTECFSVWVDEEPDGASGIFNLVASTQEKMVKKAMDQLFEEYNVRENIDILHLVVNEALARRDRGERGQDVWADNRPPEAAIRARTIPLLEAESARLQAMLKELEDKNLGLQDELEANMTACKKNDDKAAEFLKVLHDVHRQCNQLPMDEIQQWALLTAESTKPAQFS